MVFFLSGQAALESAYRIQFSSGPGSGFGRRQRESNSVIAAGKWMR
jgi:hypothetical protein